MELRFRIDEKYCIGINIAKGNVWCPYLNGTNVTCDLYHKSIKYDMSNDTYMRCRYCIKEDKNEKNSMG